MPPCCAVQAPACIAHAVRRLPIRTRATRALRSCGASRPAGRSTGRCVAKAQGSGAPEPPKRPQDDPEYYSRLLIPEADPVPRDNLTSNTKLAAGVTLLLAALVAAFLASNGAL